MRMIRTFVALAVLSTMAACASMNPVSKAETTEQKAYALYGTFVIFEEQAAKLVQSPEVPANVKQALRDADKAAKPAADAVLDGVQTVLTVRRQLLAGETTEERLAIAVSNLNLWYSTARPKVEQLVKVVKGAE